MAYPTGLKIYIDGKDATYYIFGVNSLDPDPALGTDVFRDIDITPYLRKAPGRHTVEVTAANGNGRIEARVEIR